MPNFYIFINMRKIYPLFFILLFCLTNIFTFSGCEKTDPLIESVTELRQNLYEGTGETLKLKAGYGFNLKSQKSDEQKQYYLTIKILNPAKENTGYMVCFTHEEVEYKKEFEFNPITSNYSVSFEIDNFSLKEFTVSITFGSNKEEILLKCVVPDGTITYQTALKRLREQQSNLLSNYIDENGNYNVEICARIIVKDGTPYWYIGLTDKNGVIRALLIDGLNGEVLAVKQIL